MGCVGEGGERYMLPSRSVDEIVDAIEHMSQEEREALLLRMARIDDLLEELEDVAALLRSAREPARPYQDFLDELRSEGREIQS
jgi:hypothetical protein